MQTGRLPFKNNGIGMKSNHLIQLQKVFEVQAIIQDIHPFLAKLFPIAIVENDHFLIYDTEPNQRRYSFVQKTATPMPIPQGVRAAFHLENYDNRMACVVTDDIFAEQDGYTTIFHEFIHCQQAESCEQALKQQLGVARKAQEVNDFMWELNHPFPYESSDFAKLYQSYLNQNILSEIENIRQQLKKLLNPHDYEYMVWQEWKEGFARYIENRINHRLRLPENHGGKEPPFRRVTFYEGGAHFIAILERQNPELLMNIEHLFKRMYR